MGSRGLLIRFGRAIESNKSSVDELVFLHYNMGVRGYVSLLNPSDFSMNVCVDTRRF